MSFVTRCTACGTLFKVVADQLKISDGWVRCGQCATVFDAQANLVADPSVYAAPVKSSPPSPAAWPESTAASSDDGVSNSLSPRSDSSWGNSINPLEKDALLAAFAQDNAAVDLKNLSTNQPLPAHQNAATLPANMDALSSQQRADPLFSGFSSGFSTQPPASNQAAASSTAPDLPLSPVDAMSFRPGQLRPAKELDRDAGPSTASWASSDDPLGSSILPSDQSLSISAEPTTLLLPSASSLPSSHQISVPDMDRSGPSTSPEPTPSFVAQAQRAARWRSPGMRIALSFAFLLLLAALGLQIVMHERDQIAAMRPTAKPWLDQLCQYAGCQVQPLKRIESITVDASSFNRINKNNASLEAITQSYKLSVTLKNTGALPVAIPHVELSLQDAQDQPILRRVLSPADLGSALDKLTPSQDMAGQITLQVDTAQLAGSRVQGYRVLAFYP